MKILLGDFNEKVGKEDIFKPTIGNGTSRHRGKVSDVFASLTTINAFSIRKMRTRKC
jgi:hypothetical protein